MNFRFEPQARLAVHAPARAGPVQTALEGLGGLVQQVVVGDVHLSSHVGGRSAALAYKGEEEVARARGAGILVFAGLRAGGRRT